MNAPDMTEHRKLQSYQDKIEGIEDFIEMLKDGGWKVCLVYQGYVQRELTLDSAFVYSLYGIDTGALEDEKKRAVEWALNN